MNWDGHDPQEPQVKPAAALIETLEEVGDFHRASDGFGSAMDYYKSALRSLEARRLDDPVTKGRLLRKLAECSRSKGLLEDALQYLDRAQESLAGRKPDIECAIVASARAHVFTLLGNWNAGLESAQVARELLKATSAHAEYAMVQAIAAVCHGRLGNQAEFESLSADALTTYRRIDDQAGIATLNSSMGIVYKNSCQWEKAIRCLTSAMEINEQLGQARGLARALNNLGIVYTKTHQYEKAISLLRRGRRLAQSLGDQSTLTSILNSMGQVLVLSGRYSMAEKYLLNSQNLAARYQFGRSAALADEFLGDLRQGQGRYEEAKEYYESGLRKARALAPRGDIVGELLRRMAGLQLRLGLRSQAIATAKRALRICEDCGEIYEVGFIHRTLAQALSGLGKQSEAERTLAQAVECFELAQVVFELANTQLDLAQIHLQDATNESIHRAVEEAQAASTTFHQLDDNASLYRAKVVLAEAHAALGNFDEGLLALREIEPMSTDNMALLKTAQQLREQIENDLISQVNNDSLRQDLVGGLRSVSADSFDEQILSFLQNLCEKTQSSGGFLAVVLPNADAPELTGAFKVPYSDAVRLARYFASSSELQILSERNQEFLLRFPQVTSRATSILAHPLTFDGQNIGTLYLERTSRSGATYCHDELVMISAYANLASAILGETYHRNSPTKATQVSIRPAALNPILTKVLTRDPGMYKVLELVQKVAPSDCTVMLSGETGTGKGMVAQCLHEVSGRKKRFIAVNCAAMPEQLLESELFGHAQGAFTGANQVRIGLFEAADGGTVFLDEIGKTSIAMQGKLLQFLDNATIRPVGSNEFHRVDVRIVCASIVDLKALVDQGDFLEDLYYRLSDFPIQIPPLRERHGDVRLLVDHFLRKSFKELRKKPSGMSRQSMQLLQGYVWPGNVRELANCIKRAVILADADQPIAVRHLTEEVQASAESVEAVQVQSGLGLREQLSRLETRVIASSMHKAAGNKSEAARILRISYPSLLQKLKLRKKEIERDTL